MNVEMRVEVRQDAEGTHATVYGGSPEREVAWVTEYIDNDNPLARDEHERSCRVDFDSGNGRRELGKGATLTRALGEAVFAASAVLMTDTTIQY